MEQNSNDVRLPEDWEVGKKLGKCPCCKKDVYEFSLWVETEVDIYHFSCYNNIFKGSEEE